MKDKVDCIINVCGKPLQTELTLYSLLRYSGEYIDRIFIINEHKDLAEHYGIRNKLPNIIYYETAYRQWVDPVDMARMDEDDYRLSVRYQYGWEASERHFVFITHNDCVYRGDIIGTLIENIGNAIAIGHIGQCWNCPASWEKKCDSDHYWDYRPSFDELSLLYSTTVPPGGKVKRPYHLPAFHTTFQMNPWPLPECRMNEWCALVNLFVARDLTVPIGPAAPFGAILDGGTPILDTGAGWFRDISQMGYRCKNFPTYAYMEHTAGHPSMLDSSLYALNELRALEKLRSEYGREYDCRC